MASAQLGVDVSRLLGPDAARGVDRVAVVTAVASLADPPVDAHDAYLRLHLLSHRLVRPRGANLDGLFGVLNNVVWTSAGPCSPDDFERTRLALRASGAPVQVFGIDKFPRMTDYVVPPGVRIADADRVRLGAHLAEGTTVMHEGYVNFNAGTLGTAMVEGRISAGVIVDDGSDVGGGASIMGTLSGGGKEVIRVGKRCLIGANARHRHLARRRLRRRGRPVRHRRDPGDPARRHRDQGGRAERGRRAAVPAEQHQRRRRGAGPGGRHGRAERRAPQQRLIRRRRARCSASAAVRGASCGGASCGGVSWAGAGDEGGAGGGGGGGGGGYDHDDPGPGPAAGQPGAAHGPGGADHATTGGGIWARRLRPRITPTTTATTIAPTRPAPIRPMPAAIDCARSSPTPGPTAIRSPDLPPNGIVASNS